MKRTVLVKFVRDLQPGDVIQENDPLEGILVTREVQDRVTLPTVPYTVIVPQWHPKGEPVPNVAIRHAFTLHEDMNWRGLGWFRTAPRFEEQITGYTLLAQPPSETIRRIRELADTYMATRPKYMRDLNFERVVDAEFGMESK